MTTFTMKCDIKPNIYNHLFNGHIKYDHSITVNRRDKCEFVAKDAYEIGDVVKIIPYESINQCNPVIGGTTWVGDMDKFADTIAVIKNRRTVFSDISEDSTEKVFAYSLEGDEDEWDFSAEMFVGMANKICSSRWQWVESYIVIHDEVRSGVFKIIAVDTSSEGIFGDKVTFYCIDVAIVGDFQSIITCEVDMPYYMSSSCELAKIWNE